MEVTKKSVGIFTRRIECRMAESIIQLCTIILCRLEPSCLDLLSLGYQYQIVFPVIQQYFRLTHMIDIKKVGQSDFEKIVQVGGFPAGLHNLQYAGFNSERKLAFHNLFLNAKGFTTVRCIACAMDFLSIFPSVYRFNCFQKHGNGTVQVVGSKNFQIHYSGKPLCF
jgi:hypothetical protein